MTLDEAIKHCLEQAHSMQDKADKVGGEESRQCMECAADHIQLADWLRELQQWRRVYGVCPSYEICIPECKEGYDAQIAEYQRLLKLAVEDFKKLDRENARHKNCMIPEMDCADCPLSWDSVDDRVEPCHCWCHTNEAKKLLGE